MVGFHVKAPGEIPYIYCKKSLKTNDALPKNNLTSQQHLGVFVHSHCSSETADEDSELTGMLPEELDVYAAGPVNEDKDYSAIFLHVYNGSIIVE